VLDAEPEHLEERLQALGRIAIDHGAQLGSVVSTSRLFAITPSSRRL
jgi:hypothetical protein